MFYFNYEDFKILGSSPEILVRLKKWRRLQLDLLLVQDLGEKKKEDKKYELDIIKR